MTDDESAIGDKNSCNYDEIVVVELWVGNFKVILDFGLHFSLNSVEYGR